MMGKEEGCAPGLVDKLTYLSFKCWSTFLTHLEVGRWMKHDPHSSSSNQLASVCAWKDNSHCCSFISRKLTSGEHKP